MKEREVNVSSGVATPKLRTVLVAALAMLAAALACSIAPAAASTGGVSSGDDGQSAQTSDKYDRLWDSVSAKNKRWARRTSNCESGGNPKAIGGGGRYRGAFQFMKATWRSAPKSPGGDPIKYPYRTQAVVAIALKQRAGAGQWPNCG